MMKNNSKNACKWCVLSLGIIASGVWAETTVTIEKRKSDAFYSPFGKRDPFRVPTVGGLGEDQSVAPLQRFHLEQFKLKAILRGMGEARAMFQDPRGKSHIVVQGNVIGIERATVSRIIKSEVILTERTYNYLGKESLLERVIALPQESELDPLQLVGEGVSGNEKRSPAVSSKATPPKGVSASDTNDPTLSFANADATGVPPSALDRAPDKVPAATQVGAEKLSTEPKPDASAQGISAATPVPVTTVPVTTEQVTSSPIVEQASVTKPVASPALETSLPDTQRNAPTQGVSVPPLREAQTLAPQ